MSDESNGSNGAPKTIISLGIDPGLRDTGIAAVERFPDGTYRTRGLRVSHTEPTKDKAFTNFRSSADEQRRLREHWLQITNAIQLLKPDVIGVENYLVFEPQDVSKLRQAAQDLLGLFGNALGATPLEQFQEFVRHGGTAARLLELLFALSETVNKNTRDAIGLGQAAKTIAVYGCALGAAYSSGVPVLVFEPGDRTRMVRRTKGVSKEEVGAFVESHVVGLKEYIAQKVTQKTRREHVWDATAHAILAAEQYVQMRLDVMGVSTPALSTVG